MAQTSYEQTEARAAPGMIAYCEHNSGCPLANEEAATQPYGKAVELGTDPECQFVSAGAATVFAGVTTCQHAQLDYQNVGVAQYEVNKVLQNGHVYVLVDTAVQPGDAVHYLTAAGATPGVGIGDFANAGGVDISAVAAWGSVAAPGELALLKLNMP